MEFLINKHGIGLFIWSFEISTKYKLNNYFHFSACFFALPMTEIELKVVTETYSASIRFKTYCNKCFAELSAYMVE